MVLFSRNACCTHVCTQEHADGHGMPVKEGPCDRNDSTVPQTAPPKLPAPHRPLLSWWGDTGDGAQGPDGHRLPWVARRGNSLLRGSGPAAGPQPAGTRLQGNEAKALWVVFRGLGSALVPCACSDILQLRDPRTLKPAPSYIQLGLRVADLTR